MPPTLGHQESKAPSTRLGAAPGGADKWLQTGALPHCLGRVCSDIRHCVPWDAGQNLSQGQGHGHRGNYGDPLRGGSKDAQGPEDASSPARPQHRGSRVKPPQAEHYQVHQHLHHSLRHKVLGVIQQNMPMVGVEVQAAERWQKRLTTPQPAP